MKPTYPEFYVISAKTKDEDRTDELKEMLKRGFIPANGWYKGQAEPSFLVFNKDRSYMMFLCKEFNQECILYVDSNRNGILIDRNGKETFVGPWHEIDLSNSSCENYTEVDGKTYTCSTPFNY